MTTYSMLMMTILCLWGTGSHADMGFDSKYERDYNIFNPAMRCDPGSSGGVSPLAAIARRLY